MAGKDGIIIDEDVRPTTNLKKLRDLLLPGAYLAVGRAEEITANAAYTKIFQMRRSTTATETRVHYRIPGALGGNAEGLRLKGGNVVRVHEPIDYAPDDPPQRFIWCSTHKQTRLLLGVVPEGDPRARPLFREDGTPRIFVHPEVIEPISDKDFSKGCLALGDVAEKFRTADAARIFNLATTYNPEVCGDGCAMVSPSHPHDQGTWSNCFADAHDEDPYKPLTAGNLHLAFQRISRFVDEANLRIVVRPVALLVPKALEETARVIDSPIKTIVWDALTDPKAWFLLTDVDGLPWFVRAPFEIDCYVDQCADMILVKGFERYTFSYFDPRAVFGSVPRRNRLGGKPSDAKPAEVCR